MSFFLEIILYLSIFAFSEWGPWEAWTTDKNGERKRYRYQFTKGENKIVYGKYSMFLNFFVDATVLEAPSTPEPILDPSIPFEPKAGQI